MFLCILAPQVLIYTNFRLNIRMFLYDNGFYNIFLCPFMFTYLVKKVSYMKMDAGKEAMIREDDEGNNEGKTDYECDDCKYCGNHPCSAQDLQPMLASIVET